MELGRIKWRNFIQEALSATDVAKYLYCPAKLAMRWEVGRIETEEMAQGTMVHEEKAEEILSQLTLVRAGAPETLDDVITHSKGELTKALKDRVILENPKDSILFAAVVPKLQLWGKPDRADCTNGSWPIMIEHKSKEKLPADPWPDDKVQLGIYMLGMETLGFQPQYGYLEYVLRAKEGQLKTFKVYFSKELRVLVSLTTESAKQIVDGQQEPRPDSARKCQRCEYREQCKWKLA